MKWSEKTWESIEPIFNKILVHPFIHGLMDGTLEREKFLFYINQDAIYLGEFGRVLAGIASKSNNSKYVEAFLHFSGDTMSVERALHESFLAGTDKKSLLSPSPSCLLYTSYMHKQLSSAPVEVIMASVLPCFWIYKEVGDYILANQVESENPYQSWINTYGGEEYGNAVSLAISICDEVADNCTESQRRAMTDAFTLCSKMEWMFWDSAWKLEQWAV